MEHVSLLQNVGYLHLPTFPRITLRQACGCGMQIPFNKLKTPAV